MKELVLYLVKASVALVAFYGFYWILMRRDTFFNLNRWFLLFSAGISLVIPLIHPGSLWPQQGIYLSFLPESYVGNATVNTTANLLPDPYKLAVITWLSGSLFFLVRLGIRLGQVFRVIHRGRCERRNGYIIVFVDEETHPFSFFRYIFLPARFRNNNETNPVLLHEKLHARQLHTVDLIVSELLIAFFWFNPVVFLLNRSLKSMHEYLADEAVLRSGISTKTYRELIAGNISGIPVKSFAPGFNVSLIKKRIAMMTKMRSNPLSRIKMILAVPMVLVLVFLLSGNSPAQTENSSDTRQKEKQLQVTKQEQEKSARESEVRLKEKQQQAEAEEQMMNQPEAVYNVVDKLPQYPGGTEMLLQFLGANIKYPEVAKKKGVHGTVFVTFVVKSNGKVSNAKIIRGIGSGCDEEALRVVNSMPDWIPGENKGKKVNVVFNLPIKFALN